MKITIYGVGYVGLVTGICLADIGHQVMLVGRNQEKIENLKKGIVPIYEPGLDKLIKKNFNRLKFTTNGAEAVNFADIQFIAVGTPSNPDGSCDLSQIQDVSEGIAKFLKPARRQAGPKILVIKSTVPVGTDKKIRDWVSKKYKGFFSIVSNPEFLREGTAILDFMKPDRVVIGADDPKVAVTIAKIYKPLKVKILITDISSAILIKYGSNSMLATKISFINEMANLAEKVGANIEDIADGMGLDSRIGRQFLNAGIGYGGSCFPKDVKELIHTGKNSGYRFKILDAVEEVNAYQKQTPVEKLAQKTNIKGKNIALLGLAFKPETDDMREATSLVIIDKLTRAGAKVKAWDPVAEENCQRLVPQVSYCDTAYQALNKADAAIIVTEWKQVKNLDLKKVKRVMKGKVIIDGRNVFDPKKMKKLGFDYQSVGR